MKQKHNILRTVRICLAVFFFFFITLLFLDFTGTVHAYMGWMARIQFIPALLALNFAVVAGLILLTVIFGRVYCSVICPMGVMQDAISWTRGRMKKKDRFRFSWSPAKKIMRYAFLAAFTLLLVLGLNSIATLIAPYSAYGRIAGSILAPVYALCNNVLAYFAERMDSYAFYRTDIWIRSLSTMAIAVITLLTVGVLAWRNGRTWCNTVCPVGTILGFFSKHSLFRIAIDTEKCRNCGLCGKQCKASCINMKEHFVDNDRCVACMDCVGVCNENAIRYVFAPCAKKEAGADEAAKGEKGADAGRRTFITSSALVLGAAAAKAQDMKTDGGLAPVIPKKAPERGFRLTPAGSVSHRHFYRHCTGCQLCVAACPNGVLRPSASLEHFMQPEMSYERGYCRPECTRCSDVCPAGAFHRITVEEKSSIQIGRAVVDLDLCVVNRDGVSCGNCAKHCPAAAIRLVRKDGSDSLRIPAVDTERCIGCGACENLCPSRPLSAIRVEGNDVHRTL